MTAAFLRNADALALQFGPQSIDFLRQSIRQFGVPASIDAGLRKMHQRSAFSGHIVEDFDQMRQTTAKLILRNDLDFETRVQRIYGALADLPVAAE